MRTTADIPKTQSIKYAGSKLKILPYIIEMIQPLSIQTVLDGFSGSTRVSQTFAKLGFQTTANDISVWSETLAKAYLLNTQTPQYYQPILDHLNHLKGYEGWFSEHYGGTLNNTQKRPFQLKNTKKLDAIREEIDNLNLNAVEKAVVLTSLMLALDTVDNTLGHYAAYLACWSPRSAHDMRLEVPLLFENQAQNTVNKADIFDLIKTQTYDLAYFDPPYGSNNEKMPPSRVRYNAYYHIWTTVILNDKPTLFGKVNRRYDSKDTLSASVFEEFRKDEHGNFIAIQAIQKLIQKTQAHYILLSYSSGGRANKEELYAILTASGKLKNVFEIDYKKNVMSQMRWTNQWVNQDSKYLEYLFLLEK